MSLHGLRECVKNTALIINGGYGKIKGSTFRISNMGDESVETIQQMLEAITDTLEDS